MMKQFSKWKTIKNLSGGIHKQSGRNNKGRITVRHKGGGNKKLYRQVNFNGISKNSVVCGIEYDSNRTAHIVRFLNLKTNCFFYSLKPKNLELFDSFIENRLDLIRDGETKELKFFNKGDFIYNLEIFPGSGFKFIRSGGVSGEVLQHLIINKVAYVLIKLPSGEKRLFSNKCKASLGCLDNETQGSVIWKKAGKSRGKNMRPTVRGVAMNPIDHPHGGGEGRTSGGRPSVSPKGKITKGPKTRSKKKLNFLIINQRK